MSDIEYPMQQPDLVLICWFCMRTGYTEKSVRTKIERGIWEKGVIWFKPAHNRILISLSAYDDWARREA